MQIMNFLNFIFDNFDATEIIVLGIVPENNKKINSKYVILKLYLNIFIKYF